MALKAVILGCTELPLLFTGRRAAVPLLDTMQIHIDTLITTIMED